MYIYIIPGTCEFVLYFGAKTLQKKAQTPIKVGVIKGFQVGDDILPNYIHVVDNKPL